MITEAGGTHLTGMFSLFQCYYILFIPQEIDDLIEALIQYTELYGITSLPDLHIDGCTLQHGVMTYPQDYSLKETPGKSVIILIHLPYCIVAQTSRINSLYPLLTFWVVTPFDGRPIS